MAAMRITAICKRNVIYIRQVRVKHLELTLGYMGKFFNNGSMTMTFHILNVQEGLGGHAKDAIFHRGMWYIFMIKRMLLVFLSNWFPIILRYLPQFSLF